MRTDTWDRPDWERLWLRTQSRAWKTLTVIPADEKISEPSFDVGNLIVGLGQAHGESIGLADLREARPARVPSFMRVIEWYVETGSRVVIAARSIAENLATIPIARATDCVLLCASIGSTSMLAIDETIDQIGRERFLGSVLLHPPSIRRPSRDLTVWREDRAVRP